jgi:hypothetical protein
LEGYRAGKIYWIIPKGTYLWISTRLYLFYRGKIQIIPNITGTDTVEWWTFKGDIYREIIIKFFVFYQSFDMFAYNFPEINQSSYNLVAFSELWRENHFHKEKKEYYQKELDELKTIIPIMNKKREKKKFVIKSRGFTYC